MPTVKPNPNQDSLVDLVVDGANPSNLEQV